MMNMQEEFKCHRWWKFWRAAKSAILRVIVSSNSSISTVKEFRRENFAGRLRDIDAAQLTEHRGCGMYDLLLLRPVSFSDAHQNTREARHVVAIIRRKIGSAIEGDARGRQKHRHRPAAMTGHHLHSIHVDLIKVGSLLAIDFYVHKVLIHQFRDRFVFKCLVL